MGNLYYQLLSIIIALVVPLFFLVLIVEDKGSKRLILHFCWGVLAGALAYTLNMRIGSEAGQPERMALTIAPVIEEVCKAIPLLLFLNRKKYPSLPMLIVYCAFASGIGFSVQEATYFFAASSRELADVWMLAVRTLTTSIMHGMTTAAFAIGLFVLQKQRHITIPITFGLLAVSATLHALFNLLLRADFVFIAAFMPMTMFVAGWAFVASARD